MKTKWNICLGQAGQGVGGLESRRSLGKYIGQLKSRKSSKRKEFKARTKSWSHGDSETKKTESERWSQEDIGSHTHRIEIEFLIGGSRPRLTQICTLFVSTFFFEFQKMKRFPQTLEHQRYDNNEWNDYSLFPSIKRTEFRSWLRNIFSSDDLNNLRGDKQM